MKKILFSIGSLQLGGAETVLVDILNKISKEFDIDLLLIDNTGPLLEKLNSNINVKSLVDSKNNNNLFTKIYKSLIYRGLYKYPLYCKYIYNKVLNKDYDVEVGFLSGVPCEIIKRSPNLNSKKYMWIHCEVKKDDIDTYNEYKRIYNSFDKLIGVSEMSINTFIDTFPDSKDKVELIYNYVDIDKIINKSKEKVNDAYLTNKINFISVGRVVNEKAYDRIIDLANNFKDIQFNIIGNGNEKENLEKKILNNNVTNVKFLGQKSNPYPYVLNSDVFLLSSRSEAYPTVIIEAMILNKFIIATDVPGVKEILSNYDSKIIVENSKEGIEKGIKEYLKNKDKYKKNVSGNNAFIKQNSSNLKKVVELLNEK